MDASLLLTVEVFLLPVRLFTYGGGTASSEDQTQCPDGRKCMQRRQNPMSGWGEPQVKKTNRKKKDQTELQQ